MALEPHKTRKKWFPQLTTWRVTSEKEGSWDSTEMGALLGSIFIFNVLDAIATVAWVYKGAAREGNPLMEWLIELHPVLFITLKLLLVGMGLFVLARFREHRMARGAAYALFCAFTLLLIYHIAGGMLFA